MSFLDLGYPPGPPEVECGDLAAYCLPFGEFGCDSAGTDPFFRVRSEH